MLKFKTAISLAFVVFLGIFIVFLHNTAILLLLATLIAYILRPAIDKLALNIGNRNLATWAVYCAFWGMIIAIFSLLLPSLYEQTSLLMYKIPNYKTYIQHNLLPHLINKTKGWDNQFLTKVSDLIALSTDKLLNFTLSAISNVWQYAMATINIIIFIILLPIFTLYFIKDQSILGRYATNIEKILEPKLVTFIADCINLLILFLKGQINVCLIMAAYYSLCLTIIQVDFSLLLGIISGLSIAIPFVGFLASLFITTIITIFSFGTGYQAAYVLCIFFIGQILEGYVISPKIIGDKIGIHPLIIITSLLIWGELFGILGLFLAIPITCVLKVFIQNLLRHS
jgi:putative permease